MNDDTIYEQAKDGLLEGLLQHSFEVETVEPTAYFEPAMEGVGEALPILDEEDHAILLHREAHFAGSFPLMLTAYEEEAISAVLPAEPKHIRTLFALEQQLGKNLAPFLLHASDAKKIATIRKMYRLLRDACEEKNSSQLKVISELILSEKEPEETAQEAAQFGPALIPSLLTVIDNESLYDPLFPGYGMAPVAASLTLGLLKAEQAIQPLFSMLQNGDFDIESACIKSLTLIGKKAKEFAIKTLNTRPLSSDNEKAAIALSAFSCDEEIAKAILLELQDPLVQKKDPLVFYLLACCEELPKAWHTKFVEIAKTAGLPKRVEEEMLQISKIW